MHSNYLTLLIQKSNKFSINTSITYEEMSIDEHELKILLPDDFKILGAFCTYEFFEKFSELISHAPPIQHNLFGVDVFHVSHHHFTTIAWLKGAHYK